MGAAITSQLEVAPLSVERNHPGAVRDYVAASAPDFIRLRLGVIDIEIESTIAGLADENASLYHGYANHDSDAHIAVRVERGRSHYTMGRRFIVSGSEGRMFSVRRVEEVLPHVEWALNWEVVRRMDSYLQLHAGVMERDGALVALIVPNLAEITKAGALKAEDAIRVALGTVATRLPPTWRLAGFALTREPLPRTRLGKLRRFRLPELYERARAGGGQAEPRVLTAEERAWIDTPPRAAV